MATPLGCRGSGLKPTTSFPVTSGTSLTSLKLSLLALKMRRMVFSELL